MLFAVRGRFHRGKDCASVVGRKTSSQCVVGTTIAHIGNLLSPFVEIFVSISLVVVEMSRKEVQKKADSARQPWHKVEKQMRYVLSLIEMMKAGAVFNKYKEIRNPTVLSLTERWHVLSLRANRLKAEFYNEMVAKAFQARELVKELTWKSESAVGAPYRKKNAVRDDIAMELAVGTILIYLYFLQSCISLFR